MGSSRGSSSNFKNFTHSTSTQLAASSPFSYLHVSSPSSSDSDANFIGSKGINPKYAEGSVDHHHHQRCSSENNIIEDQPSWLEELLSEPDQRVHRRSASDSCAYLGSGTEPFTIKKNSKPTEKHVKEESKVQKVEAFAEKSNPAQAKSFASKTDSKRAKQQSAHRSRVRKLKYIGELERTVHLLQAEGSEIHAELEFVNQQNLILSMENRALRQRLDGLSQEQLIKHFEQEMLERELARLQTLYQLQSQQQMQMQQQQPLQQHSRHLRTKSRDLEPQLANLSIKKKEAGSSRGSASSSSVRM